MQNRIIMELCTQVKKRLNSTFCITYSINSIFVHIFSYNFSGVNLFDDFPDLIKNQNTCHSI